MARKLSFTTPFLVAIFSVVSLYAANADRLPPGQMVVPLIFGLLIAGLFLLLFWLLKWTAHAAPLYAIFYTGVFLFWNIVPWQVNVLGMAVALLPLVFKNKTHTTYSTLYVGLVLAIAIVASGVQAGIKDVGKVESLTVGDSYITVAGQRNIYFIIPDRLPSPAAMREAGIDPDQAIADLRSLGFYVDEDKLSTDPYTIGYEGPVHTTRTMRYLASVLNGGASIPIDIGYQDCRTMIRDNALFTWLHSRGYKIVNVASWFAETAEFPDADSNLRYEDVTLMERLFQDELTTAYYERTILYGLNLRVLEADSLQRRVEAGRLVWQGQQITGIAESGQTSVFTFAHLMAPHEPFVYADKGLSIPEQYYANIRYVLGYLTDLAARIRAADPSAIIIIQADEGMAYRKPVELNRDLSAVQWSGVFSAWYIPNYTGKDLDQVRHTDILALVIEGRGF